MSFEWPVRGSMAVLAAGEGHPGVENWQGRSVFDGKFRRENASSKNDIVRWKFFSNLAIVKMNPQLSTREVALRTEQNSKELSRQDLEDAFPPEWDLSARDAVPARRRRLADYYAADKHPC